MLWGEMCNFRFLQNAATDPKYFQHERELKGMFYAMSPHEASC